MFYGDGPDSSREKGEQGDRVVVMQEQAQGWQRE